MPQTLVAALGLVLAASVAPPPETPALRVVVLGDANGQLADAERAFDSWPEQLGRMLGGRSEVVNCSRVGIRLDPAAPRFVVATPEFRQAEEARADVVLVALGASDFAVADGAAPAVMRSGLEATLAALEPFRPEPRIFLCLPPPTPNSGRRASTFLAAREANRPVFMGLAQERKLGFIDLGEAFRVEAMDPSDSPAPGPEDATRLAAHVFRALTGREPAEGSGPYRESLDPGSFDRRVLVEAGEAKMAASGWTAGSGDSAGFLVSGPESDPLLMEGAIPEGPFRMTWRFRWRAGDRISERGGPQVGTSGNLLWLDDRNATMALFGREVRGTPELPATARVAPQGEMLEIELRRHQGVLEWRMAGRMLYRTAFPSKALGQAGLRPEGSRVELESWTLDLPRP